MSPSKNASLLLHSFYQYHLCNVSLSTHHSDAERYPQLLCNGISILQDPADRDFKSAFTTRTLAKISTDFFHYSVSAVCSGSDPPSSLIKAWVLLLFLLLSLSGHKAVEMSDSTFLPILASDVSYVGFSQSIIQSHKRLKIVESKSYTLRCLLQLQKQTNILV